MSPTRIIYSLHQCMVSWEAYGYSLLVVTYMLWHLSKIFSFKLIYFQTYIYSSPTLFRLFD